MRQTANKVLVVGSERFVEEVEDLTGKILKEQQVRELVNLAIEYDFYILSDEILANAQRGDCKL